MTNLSNFFNKFRILTTYALPFVWGFLLMFVLNVTNPLASGPLSILVVFVLLYLLIFNVLYACAHLFSKVWLLIKRNKPWPMRKVYYALCVISLAPVLMVALNTLGQLAITELTLIIVLVSVGVFYAIRKN